MASKRLNKDGRRQELLMNEPEKNREWCRGRCRFSWRKENLQQLLEGFLLSEQIYVILFSQNSARPESEIEQLLCNLEEKDLNQNVKEGKIVTPCGTRCDILIPHSSPKTSLPGCLCDCVW